MNIYHDVYIDDFYYIEFRRKEAKGLALTREHDMSVHAYIEASVSDAINKP